MLKFAANLTFMYTETPFLERIARARASGFRYIEFHNPYPFCEDPDAILEAVTAQGVRIIHFNLPGGDWEAGERGIAAWPDRIEEFRSAVEDTIRIAARLGCRQLNCPVGYPRPEFSLAEQQRTLADNLGFAARAMAQAGIMLLIEPLNPITHPGYLLIDTPAAAALQDRVGHPNLRIQYDYYQMQRCEGELAATVRRYYDRIGYIQLADNPGRHEPGTGEINFRYLLKDLESLGFDGFVSLEYTPTGRTEQSLGWIEDYGFALSEGGH